MDTEPPVDAWEEAEALREVLRIARGVRHEDFERDVVPRLRRLSSAQRVRVAQAMEAALKQEFGEGPDGSG